jgi:hypothetical protein
VWLAQSASATTNFNWTGGGDATTWSQGANWSQGYAPPAGPAATNTFQVFIGTGFPTTSPLPINIGPADVVQLSDQLFGPEWGQTLNIYGSVNAGFGFAPVGDMSGPKSTVNLYGNGSYTSLDSIFLGDMFWFAGGPNVDMNLYDNSHVTTKYFALGGHLNIYGGTVTVSTAMLIGPSGSGFWGGVSTDATRLIDVAGGQLVVGGDATAMVNDLIARGIMEGNGIVGNVNIDTVSEPGFTVITAAPEPGTMALLCLGGLAGVVATRRRR